MIFRTKNETLVKKFLKETAGEPYLCVETIKH